MLKLTLKNKSELYPCDLKTALIFFLEEKSDLGILRKLASEPVKIELTTAYQVTEAKGLLRSLAYLISHERYLFPVPHRGTKYVEWPQSDCYILSNSGKFEHVSECKSPKQFRVQEMPHIASITLRPVISGMLFIKFNHDELPEIEPILDGYPGQNSLTIFTPKRVIEFRHGRVELTKSID